MKEVICIENNGGGLQFEEYQDGELISIAAGLEFAPDGDGIEDLRNYGATWYWPDCGGNTTGYSLDNNTSGDTHHETGEILTATDVQDNLDSSRVVARRTDGGEVVLRPEVMGAAAHSYFYGASN